LAKNVYLPEKIKNLLLLFFARSEFVPSVQSEHNYGNINHMIEEERRHQIQRQRRSSGRRREGGRGEAQMEPTLSRAASQQLFSPPQGISIPQVKNIDTNFTHMPTFGHLNLAIQ
jgi:hypothetical protein